MCEILGSLNIVIIANLICINAEKEIENSERKIGSRSHIIIGGTHLSKGWLWGRSYYYLTVLVTVVAAGTNT